MDKVIPWSHDACMKKSVGKQKDKRRVGRPRKTEVGANEVRGKILEAAEHVFSEKGIHAAGLREIAKRSRHSLAIVTYYFKTKENLVLEVLDRHLEDHREAIAEVLQKYRGELSMEGLADVSRAAMAWYGTEAGLRSHRIQLSTKLDKSRKLETRARDYWTRSTEMMATMIRGLNPKLDEAESLQRALILLLLLQVRTDLHWVYAGNSGQKRDPARVVQGYEKWLLARILPMLVEQEAPK